MKPLFPLFLDLEGKRVLVVGAGSVGARKIDELVAAKAIVRVVSLHALESVIDRARSGAIEIERRAFAETDVDGAWLVIAATNDPKVNGAIARACEARRVFVNAVDDPARSSAIFASIVRRAPFTIAISSSGELPALSKLLRTVIEAVLPEERWIDAARALRVKWKKDQTPMKDRFAELVRAIAGELPRA